jgi:1-acyl-sn-glycerol-3-phosphate acyltransferase
VTDWRADGPDATRQTEPRQTEPRQTEPRQTDACDDDAVDVSTLELPGMPGAELVPVRPSRSERDADREVRDSDVDGWGRSERVRAVARRLYDPVYRRWFRVEWEGLEHIPREGGALIIANHGGAVPSDAPVIMHGVETELERPVYGLADNLFRRVPVIGTLWARSGGVPAHPDNAFRLLHDEQQLVLAFPEGTKATGKLARDRYQLQRFGRGGFVEIAMRAGVPIVPVAIVGNEEAMPIVWKSSLLARLIGVPYFPVTANQFLFGPVLGLVVPLPAKFRLRVLPPVTFDVATNQSRYNRSLVMEHAEAIRASIQAAVNDMLRTRQSVWKG